MLMDEVIKIPVLSDKESKLAKVRTLVTKTRVLDLIEQRAKDDDTALPKIPSAQTWFRMSEVEHEEFWKAVEAAGAVRSDYEKIMKEHWPEVRNA